MEISQLAERRDGAGTFFGRPLRPLQNFVHRILHEGNKQAQLVRAAGADDGVVNFSRHLRRRNTNAGQVAQFWKAASGERAWKAAIPRSNATILTAQTIFSSCSVYVDAILR